MDKRKYKKRTAWTGVSEEMLVEMWEDKILQLRGNRKNQHVYAEIASELEKKNFLISAADVQAKIHNLTSRYRKEKALDGPSGGSPSEWPLYGRIHMLLGAYRYYNISQNTVDSVPAPRAAATEAAATEAAGTEAAATEEAAAAEPSAWDFCDLNESSASTSTVASPLPVGDGLRTTKKNRFQQIINEVREVRDLIQSQVTKMDDTDAEMKSLETRKTELLETLVHKQCTVLDSMMEYIKKKE